MRNGLFHHGGSEGLVTIPGGDNRVLAQRLVYGRTCNTGDARSHCATHAVQQHRLWRPRMLCVEPSIETGLHRRDLPPRVVLSHPQRTRHPVYLLPVREGQHPVGVPAQFRDSLLGPDFANLVGQADVEAVVIQKRNDAGLFGHSAPSLHQLLRTVFREYTGKLFDIALAQYSMETGPKLCPQPGGFSFPDAKAIKGRMLHEEIDDEPARWLDQGRLFHMHLIAVGRMAPSLSFD